MSTLSENVRRMKEISPSTAALDPAVRTGILQSVRDALIEHKDEIFSANRTDMDRARMDNIAPAVMKRLLFDGHKLDDCIKGIESLITLPDPAGRVTLRRQLDEGLILERVSVPIGVIGIIFEARPDALVQISCLCIKSGNCAVLKGGRETASTNKVLFDIIAQAAYAAGLPDGSLLQVSAHSEVDELLGLDGCVDLLIPRGSNAFVRYIMDHTKIPVMGHSDGICHTYVDKAADFDMAIPILIDAKTQYTAACNATETLLVHRDIAGAFLPKAARALSEAGVRLRGSMEAAAILNHESVSAGAGFSSASAHKDNAGFSALSASARNDNADSSTFSASARMDNADSSALIASGDIMSDNEFSTEYLDKVLSVKLVGSVEEAAAHINRFGSHHTDCIITQDDEAAARFMTLVDSAGVYRNCSTRFADGFRYGFGAEVGISTSKLHARGPVGLDGLVTYKYLLRGTGQIVGDYASGKKNFHFRDI